MAELLTTSDVLERLGWKARSSLWRAERAGRIRRARTIGRRPFYRAKDVERLAAGAGAGEAAPDSSGDVVDVDQDDEELASLRAELAQLLAAGELDGTPTLRLMTSILRRQLALRAERGELVDVDELLRLDKLELRVLNREQFEELRELTRHR